MRQYKAQQHARIPVGDSVVVLGRSLKQLYAFTTRKDLHEGRKEERKVKGSTTSAKYDAADPQLPGIGRGNALSPNYSSAMHPRHNLLGTPEILP
ncbi:hypothetical protein N7532_008916 [Penicillium argentinense]|uniref:Uncharacterized protein n=1 Tax=Penicillium argentinense TaxID=1131581 RepID=A0A9W9EYD4_9EURO|nr:uncharacterized protein N7532_008916 [Penicillium argentinense]KAJ5090232.1 hypothetical protein N7532_008916 [Penicillium argentinense]